MTPSLRASMRETSPRPRRRKPRCTAGSRFERVSLITHASLRFRRDVGILGLHCFKTGRAPLPLSVRALSLSARGHYSRSALLRQDSMRTPRPQTHTTQTSRAAGMFRALSHRNFRLFLSGAFLSNTGTWMQSVAQGWLVLQLTNSGAWLG